MNIVVVVTRGTLRNQLYLVRGFAVAVFASRGRVFPKQGKVGHRIVIEIDFLPVVLCMTSHAIGAISAIMSVILSMTSNTGGRRCGHLRGLQMTTLASCCFMRAAQGKIGQAIMVEHDPVPRSGNVTVFA